MKQNTLSDGEWKLMNLLWLSSPRTIGELVNELKDDTGWTKATVNMMLLRLTEKGAVRVEEGGRAKKFYPVLEQAEAVKQEARQVFQRVKTGGVGLLVSTMAQDGQWTDEEIDELYRILKSGRKGHD